MDLVELLKGCSSGDASVRERSEAGLLEWSVSNLGGYLGGLCLVLQDVGESVYLRQLAGLLLKNEVFGKSRKSTRAKWAGWAALDVSVREGVKKSVVGALQDGNVSVSRAAAQVCSKIGLIELEMHDGWSELFTTLMALATSAQENLKISAQTAVGYLCEDLLESELASKNDCGLSPAQASAVLTMAVQGMRDTNPTIVLASCKAFYFACVVASVVIDREVDRNVVMEVVCQNCKSSTTAIQAAAFEILVQFASEYYNYLQPYMNVIGALTFEAIAHSCDAVAIPALEIWNTICDVELGGGTFKLVERAKSKLLPLLFEALCKQKENDDEDLYTIAMAAGTCLSLCALVLKDDILEISLAFLNSNFFATDHRRREAALMAYGCIMEGPSEQRVRAVLTSSVEKLMSRLGDESSLVRDTAAWVLGRIASQHPEVLVPFLSKNVDEENTLLALIVAKLADKPGIAVNLCWTLESLAGHISPEVVSPLHIHFPQICQALLTLAKRPDAEEKQLRESACGALSVLVERTCGENEKFMGELLVYFGVELKTGSELTSQLGACVCLQSLLYRLRPVPVAQVQELAVLLIGFVRAAHAKLGFCVEEGIGALGALLICCEPEKCGEVAEFVLAEMRDLILSAVENFDYVLPCRSVVELIGDIARKGGKNVFFPIAKETLQLFYVILPDSNADQKLKPAVIMCIGDIAAALSEDFIPFLDPFLTLIVQAAALQPEDGFEEDEEWLTYINALREAVLHAYNSILIGVKQKPDVLKLHVNRILQVLQTFITSPQLPNTILHAVVTLTADLVAAYGGELTEHVKKLPLVVTLAEKAPQVQSPQVRQRLQWLLNELGYFEGPVA